MKKLTGIVIGALLVAAGVIYILNAFGIADINISFDGWWSLFIIIPCLEGVLTDRDKTGSILGLIVGIMLLLAARNVIDYTLIWQLVIPLILIAIGIKMIRKATHTGEKNAEGTNAIFSSGTIDYTGKELRLAKITAVFGGTTCNLLNAKIHNDSQVELFCMFGGADILVPENVNIKINTFCLFGGIADKRKIKNDTESSTTLHINGFCLFGGADIK